MNRAISEFVGGLAALLLLAGAAAADPAAPNAPGAPDAPGSDEVRIVPPAHYMLDNGLEIVVIPDHRAPVVTHMIWYKAGAADEPLGKSGIAHFLEHLMFKGTSTRPAGEFSRKVAEIGGKENAFTTADYTAYYQTVTPQALGMVMAYEADRMENLVLDDASVLPERDVVLEERRQRVDNNPGSKLAEALSAAVYANHPYGIPIIGWAHEIAALTRDDAMRFYDRYYTPNNAILVVAGDVEPQTVLQLAEETYGKVARRAEPGLRERPLEPALDAAITVSYSDARVTTPSLRRIYPVPSYNRAEAGEAEALDLLASILGGASTSRIKRDLLVDDPVAAQGGASYWGGFYDRAELSVYATPLPGHALKAVEARLDEIIDSIVAGGVTEEELSTAKNRLIKRALFSRDDQTAMARLYGSTLATGGTVADVTEWTDRIRAVTADQVNAAARTYLRPERSVTGYLTPEAS